MKLYALVPAATYALSTAAPPTIKIRFVNTKEGADVTTEVRENTNLLNAADDAGVKIPRACRNGPVARARTWIGYALVQNPRRRRHSARHVT